MNNRSHTSTRSEGNADPRVAVVGAGISGLICANILQDHGIHVQVFEKSRGVGGRMATRRGPAGEQFDHGAQYFTARDSRFEHYVRAWEEAGTVAEWGGRIATLSNGQFELKDRTTKRFVGVPSMTAVCKQLASELEINLNVRVAGLERSLKVWRLLQEDGRSLGEFHCVITSAPAAQSAELLASVPRLQEKAIATKMDGCWAAMLAFDEPLDAAFDAAFVHESLLSWIARNDTKPGRDGDREGRPRGGDCWVVHASPDWTERHIEDDPSSVLPQLTEAFWQATGIPSQEPSFASIHRWRYSIPPEPLEEGCLYDSEMGVGACGDWCNGARVEGAALSGLAIANAVLAQLGQ